MPTINDPMVGPGGVRSVVAQWVITGTLELQSAAHLGNGEKGEAVDMPLLRDRLEGKPLLTGSSLAGGLRSYLLDRLDGYGKDEGSGSVASTLFGGARGDDGQSPLIVFDSLCEPPADWVAEIRDGVAIKPTTGLAEDHKKFDLEVLPPGTTFPLRFELVVSDQNTEQNQVSLLATALKGLEEGEIPIGARRSRGLGACRAKNWRAKRFGLTTRQGWLAWLGSDYGYDSGHPLLPDIPSQTNIGQALKAELSTLTFNIHQHDCRKRLIISATLTLNGGLLVRSPGTDATAADVTHLASDGKPVLPGTSLTGVLRTRALRIARVVRNEKGDAGEWVDLLFGLRLEGTTNLNLQPHASRLRVTEKEVRNGNRLCPNRVKIDRFTGGVVDGALFDEEPIYRGQVEVKMEVRNPKSGEAGLLLLLLKDLLTGDLPAGGTSSVGRGVMKGTAIIFMDGKQFSLNPEKRADPETARVLNQKVQELHNV